MEVERPDTTQVGPVVEASPPAEPAPQSRPRPARPREARPPADSGAGSAAAVDTSLAAPSPEATPPQTPVLTVRLSAAEQVRLEAQLNSDIDRANGALQQVRRRLLSEEQTQQLKTAQSFLDEARSALEAQDLQRACTLAEKSRIMAEELKSSLGK